MIYAASSVKHYDKATLRRLSSELRQLGFTVVKEKGALVVISSATSDPNDHLADDFVASIIENTDGAYILDDVFGPDTVTPSATLMLVRRCILYLFVTIILTLCVVGVVTLLAKGPR